MMTSTDATTASSHGEKPVEYVDERKWWMGVLARATAQDFYALNSFIPPKESYRLIKKPEIGTVMVEARAGGAGRRFNFGEASVTRCVVQLVSGELGFSYALGRDKGKAEQAALIDAILQSGDAYVKNTILSILKTIEKKHLAAKDLQSRKAAATKVNFFTLVRGEG
jgi:alpha-D-ribose 1-methylphosphonate 5-triphosphate synthase subunit PhnG